MVQHGRVLENRREGEEDETRNFREKYELEILAVVNHKLCFDITQILSLVLDFFSTKHGITL